MGGYGSGRPRAHLYLGQLLRLDVLRLRPHVLRENPALLSLRWETGASIGLSVTRSSVTLNYAVTVDDKRDLVSFVVPVTQLPCRYGNTRPLFLCPRCYGRSRFLYLYRRRFVCRRCTGLKYWTQTVSPMTRLDHAIRKLQRRLAEPDDDVDYWDLDYFPRAKWMRRRTHARLEQRGLLLAEKRDHAWFCSVAPFFARHGWPEGFEP